METTAATPLAERDYFSDRSILRDPYAWFEAVRARGPIWQDERSGIIYVTGFEEAVAILTDSANFSNYLTTQGSLAPLPFVPHGDDITGQIADATDTSQMAWLMINYDGQDHANARTLLNRLFTPSKLRANEQFMDDYAETLVSGIVARGGCELINEIATPYVTLVIADLLGVPEDDRNAFRRVIDEGPPSGNVDDPDNTEASAALMFMGQYFMRYVTERRANPKDDVLSDLANATLPDGSRHEALEVVKAAMFLFAAGQDTSAKLLGNAMRFVLDDDGLQRRLRADPSLIPDFLEEVLRLEGSTKTTFRVTSRTTTIGDFEFKAGSRVTIAISAANRDPRRWENPAELVIGRPRIREHVGFSRGAHTCIGAPLARVEIRVIFEKLFAQTDWIALDAAKHPDGLSYEPSFIIRGLENLNITVTPAG